MENDFRAFLSAKLKEKGLTLKKLSELTGIILKHLENLNSGNLSDLPPSPYLHGYLIKIAEVLEFDAEEWWPVLKSEEEVSSSGAEDALPKNRFAKKPHTKKISLALIGLVVLLLFGLRLPKIIGLPEIAVTYPSGDATLTVSAEEITVQGSLKGGDKVMLNGEAIPLNADGSWQKSILLAPGLNTIEITAKKFLGRETKVTRQVIYAPSEEKNHSSSTPSSTSPTDN
ncbi:MAG: helix-turn-helix domain-containing protein [Candidatus Liptonbacteria bacterium]|nr:helix-turn-helix domain-containing protein [Candidatus Liptonbacteria bacterium]